MGNLEKKAKRIKINGKQIIVHIYILAVLFIALFFALTRPANSQPISSDTTVEPRNSTFIIYVSQWQYEPLRIEVNLGGQVHIELISKDVSHGFFIDGYEVQTRADYINKGHLNFTADKPGKFKIRCNVICGTYHIYLTGDLIVTTPVQYGNQSFALNVPFLLLVIILVLALIFALKKKETELGERLKKDLMNISIIRKIGYSRKIISSIGIVTFLFIGFVILTGLIGTNTGAHNFATISVWIVWWFALIVILVPLFGRIWCSFCPIPLPAEWLRRKAIFGVRKLECGMRSAECGVRKRNFPVDYKNVWLQTIYLAVIAAFTYILTTSPFLTALLILFGSLFFAFFVDFFYRGRYFCRYICPIGAFLSLKATAGLIEVRPKDEELCKLHKGKECITVGTKIGNPCPWMIYPGGIKRNNDCGLCLECIKACPYDNMRIRTRMPYEELRASKNWKLDESFQSIILMALAFMYILLHENLFYSLIIAGRFQSGFSNYLLYLGFFWGLTFFVFPGVIYIVSIFSKKLIPQYTKYETQDTIRIFSINAHSLIPLGMFIWIAYSIPYLLVNWGYILPVITDPFGWGWNILSFLPVDARSSGKPFFTLGIPYIQSLLMITGLVFSVRITKRVFTGTVKSAYPIIIFQTLFTVILIYIFTS